MTPSTGPGTRQASFGERIMLRQYIHWRRLIGESVEIRQHGQIIRTGTVDDAMADSTALWIAGDATQPRTVYEAALGQPADLPAAGGPSGSRRTFRRPAADAMTC